MPRTPSFTGASWIESLVGLFAGGSALVAAKVAALGVGAAAVGSSAVVVPHVLDNHAHVRPAPQRLAAVHPKRHDTAPAPVFAERLVSAPAETSTHNAIAGSDEAGSGRAAVTTGMRSI